MTVYNVTAIFGTDHDAVVEVERCAVCRDRIQLPRYVELRSGHKVCLSCAKEAQT